MVKKTTKVKRKAKKYADSNTFAFLIHPLDIEDVTKKYKIASKVSPKVVASVLKRRRPFVMAEIKGITSLTGQPAIGWFIVVPLLPWQFIELEEDYVVDKIAKACKVAKKQGAKIVGLGAFTAIVGNGGRQVANKVDIPITTGNTYTTTTAIQATKKAAQMMDIDLRQATIAVVGATGSIGKAAATVLAPDAGEVYLLGRYLESLEETAEDILRQNHATNIKISTEVSKTLRKADVVISVTGSVDSIIYPDDLKSGAVICDVARPRDVSDLVAQVRDDVLVIDGGIVEVPGDVEFGVDFGPPPKMAEGCIAETIILALENKYENYTLGKNITPAMVKEMADLADKHGFKIAGLRRQEKMVTELQISEIKKRVKKKAESV
ncbi:MAG: shikimate dehydrogenase [Actinobacteria bacterium]|nr:MAG: shikimate dehydrogenase [Actinomycetota bacterium]